jgi:hypothetical protein
VSCVEQGPWHDVGPASAAGEAVYPGLRAKKVEDVARSYGVMGASPADQGRVWQEIAGRQSRMGTRSATQAMRDTYEQRAAHLASMLKRLPCSDDGPIGVVALVASRARCADIFDRPETLASYWPRLVRSYAMEVLDQPPIRPSIDSAGAPAQPARRRARPPFARSALVSTSAATETALRGPRWSRGLPHPPGLVQAAWEGRFGPVPF